MNYEPWIRQVTLPDFGLIGQQKLLDAKVLVVGAGGLGCPALLYLAAMGVGTLGIADFDVVETTNLNRQILFGAADVGKQKATLASEKLAEQYPNIKFIAYKTKIVATNALAILQDFDVIIDASDNFATRYLLNDACVLLGKALIFGSIYRMEGQVSVFNHGGNESVNYRDIYPRSDKNNEAPNCAEAGVLGVLPGIIGTLQACETVKIITKMGTLLSGDLLVVDAAHMRFVKVAIEPNFASRKQAPATIEDFESFNYDESCS